MTEKSTKKLIGVRVTPDAWRALRSAMVAQDFDNLQDVVGPVVEDFALRLSEEPEIREMLDQARKLRGKDEGSVTKLDDARKRPSADLG